MRNFWDNPALIAVLIVIIILVFGANKLPGAARSLGRSMRIFKSEVKQMKDDDPPTGSTARGESPLEGRVVDDESGRTDTRSDSRTAPPSRPSKDL